MPSPFPGMNPYLERPGVWHKFHGHFCHRCMEALVPQLAQRYIVDVDEHVYIHELPARERRLVGRPDVFISAAEPAQTHASAAAQTVAPVYARLPELAIDEEHLPYLTILDGATREVVTVVELLSPSNKVTDRSQYVAKRQRYIDAGVALVEIDLLRGGQRMPAEQLPVSDYCVMVFRPEEASRIGVWPINLRDPLPKIPVPLHQGDEDAAIDLQSLLHVVYDAGGYERYIYAGEPEPPLKAEDANWARGIAPG